jgi:hypothetical protein
MHYEQAAAQMAEAAQTSDPNKRPKQEIKQTSQPNDAHVRINFPPRCQGCFALSKKREKRVILASFCIRGWHRREKRDLHFPS